MPSANFDREGDNFTPVDPDVIFQSSGAFSTNVCSLEFSKKLISRPAGTACTAFTSLGDTNTFKASKKSVFVSNHLPMIATQSTANEIARLPSVPTILIL